MLGTMFSIWEVGVFSSEGKGQIRFLHCLRTSSVIIPVRRGYSVFVSQHGKHTLRAVAIIRLSGRECILPNHANAKVLI